ncbi:MAG: hypothetical protein KatS3mg101_0749 [Patescibacteria group bacterium]|nr:MAG: hypothetical protein KatS3mg101_0749 [Patescibacteria group bacterium]
MRKNYILLILLVFVMSALVALLVYRAHKNDIYFESQNRPSEPEGSLEVLEI